MTDDTPTDNESVGMTEVEQLTEEQVRRVVQDEVGQLIEVRSNAESPGLEDVWIAGQPLGKIIESNRETAKSAEKLAREARSSDDNPTGKGGETGSNGDELLPIERLARMKEQDSEHPALPSNGRASFDRAVAIFKNFRQWSSKAPSGRVIKSNLKALVETATDENLFWSQIGRACRMLERFSAGSITYKKTSRHGWILIAENQSVLASTR